MISPRLNLHHVRTAFIAWHLARASRFSLARSRKTLLAALLHDIGGLNETSRLQPLSYYDNEHNDHAAIGGVLLTSVPLLNPLNDIVRYHHTRWDNGNGARVNGIDVPEESHVIYLADRLDILIARYPDEDLLTLKERISAIILADTDSLFKPEYVAAFQKIAQNEHFWQQMQSTDFSDYLNEIPRIHHDVISLHNFRDIAAMLAFIIDGVTQHGVHHSLAVGRISGYLARERGIAPAQCLKIETGGLLHNLSSLALYTCPGSTEKENSAWMALHPIAEIRDIAGWCQLLDDTAENISPSPEVAILRTSILLVSLLQEVTLEAEFTARIARSAEITPALTPMLRNHSAVIVQIYQQSLRERRELLAQINRLSQG